MRSYALTVVLLLSLAAGTVACQPAANVEADTAAVTAVVDAFYGAMKKQDPMAAMALIAEDAMFVESGRLETRTQYEENHLPLDIDFEQMITGNRTSMRVTVDRDAAWVIAETEFRGEFEGSPLAFVSSQLMVLTRQDSEWKIRSIHWSSRQLDA